ncbi:hypothetical protein C1645_818447 [Glomus cerebriforme]|uniref:Uncharacterized protein n=1 Tax=Glomus cerebriforme TaxID=658196 RepID=A0A397T7I3_9GLOM|nr:hypothetical protein C1645_818447 [Glomus cerebriforme]
MSATYERFIDLYIQCPGKTCNNKAITYWYHKPEECRSNIITRMKISTRAKIKCGYCNVPSHIRHWRFACDFHKNSYQETSETKFAKALSIARKMEAIDYNFANQLIDYLGDNDWEMD